MIPRIIHYVWVGSKPLPADAKQYIEGWKKLCPDYEIMEWNNDSLKDISCEYVHQAFECRRWAFVSDFLRLYALKTCGGFYFDTDWEMTQSIDCFRNYSYVTGFENWEGNYSPVTAMMAAEPNNKLISELLSEYDGMSFIDKEGKENITTNTVLISNYLEQKYGLVKPWDGTKKLELEEGYVIFPSSYFCSPEEGNINYGIHHFVASWWPTSRRRTIAQFGQFQLVRFLKTAEIKKNWIELRSNERILIKIPLTFKRCYCLLQNKQS